MFFGARRYAQFGIPRLTLSDRLAEYAADLGYVRSITCDGNERANEIAAQTLAEVPNAMGMRY